MKPTRDEITLAAKKGNLKLLREFVDQGADLNDIDENNGSLLAAVLFEVCPNRLPHRYAIVKYLLEQGANPNTGNNSSPLASAIMRNDVKMTRMLLKAGANPNLPYYDDLPLDIAFTEYGWYTCGAKPQEAPTDADLKNDDTIIRYLGRLAKERNGLKPDILNLLRGHGAKSKVAMEEEQVH